MPPAFLMLSARAFSILRLSVRAAASLVLSALALSAFFLAESARAESAFSRSMRDRIESGTGPPALVMLSETAWRVLRLSARAPALRMLSAFARSMSLRLSSTTLARSRS